MAHYGNESEVGREQEANREIEMNRAKLIQAEASGFTEQSSAEVLKDIRRGLGRDAL